MPAMLEAGPGRVKGLRVDAPPPAPPLPEVRTGRRNGEVPSFLLLPLMRAMVAEMLLPAPASPPMCEVDICACSEGLCWEAGAVPGAAATAELAVIIGFRTGAGTAELLTAACAPAKCSGDIET